MNLTCIHADDGLCEDCHEAFEYDPESYMEYGDHPDGLRRFAELRQELAAVPTHQCPANDIPY